MTSPHRPQDTTPDTPILRPVPRLGSAFRPITEYDTSSDTITVPLKDQTQPRYTTRPDTPHSSIYRLCVLPISLSQTHCVDGHLERRISPVKAMHHQQCPSVK